MASSAALTRVSSFAQAICGWTRPPRPADLEMLTRVLAAEQHPPDLHAVTLRQASWILTCRSARVHGRRMLLPTVEVFKGFQRDRRLVAPAVTASKIIARLVFGGVERGRTCGCHEL